MVYRPLLLWVRSAISVDTPFEGPHVTVRVFLYFLHFYFSCMYDYRSLQRPRSPVIPTGSHHQYTHIYIYIYMHLYIVLCDGRCQFDVFEDGNGADRVPMK